MIKAKLLAMCVCPVIAAPPAILAVHAPARHAVAHLLHRAAARLDHATPAPTLVRTTTPASAAVSALPCTPSGGGSGGGLPVTGGSLIGGLLLMPTLTSAAADGFASGGGGFGGSGGGGFGRGASGGGGGASGGGGGGGGGAFGGGGGGLPGSMSGSSDGVPTGGMTVGDDLPLPPGGLSPAMPGGYPSTSPVSGTPEPATWAFLVIGFGLVGAVARRDRPVRAAG